MVSGHYSKQTENNAFKSKSLGIRLGKCETVPIHRLWHTVMWGAPCYTQGIPLNLNIRWRMQSMDWGYIQLCHISALNYHENKFRIMFIYIMLASNNESCVKPYRCSVTYCDHNTHTAVRTYTRYSTYDNKWQQTSTVCVKLHTNIVLVYRTLLKTQEVDIS